MKKVYICVYNHPISNDCRRKYNDADKTQRFVRELSSNKLIDIGDDPSFYCSKINGSNVTWGICRPDVRRNLNPGDLVIFFCQNQVDNKYLYSGYATVMKNINPIQIWEDEKYKIYREYFNHLIVYSKGRYQRKEPLFKMSSWHDEFHKRLRGKGENEMLKVFDPITERRSEIEVGNTYVIFSNKNDKTSFFNNPVEVAFWKRGAKNEKWLNTKISKSVRKYTLDQVLEFYPKKSNRKSLRIHENNAGNRHLRANVNEKDFQKLKKGLIKLHKHIMVS